MDNVTHGLAGLLVADAANHWLERRGITLSTKRRRALSALGIVAAEFPDSDLVYSGPVLDMGSLGYLLHHRGHTHTIVWALVSALVLWVGFDRWGKAEGGSTNGGSTNSGSTNGGSVNSGVARRAFLGVALIGTLSHLLLDFTNSYGVHPFWPFDGRWFYGDAVFIVEPWLWLVAIPPLFWNRPSRLGRVLLLLFFVVIVAAILLLGQVARDVAVVLVLFAAVWPVVMWRLSSRARTAAGIGAWGAATVGFFVASAAVKSNVRDAVAQSRGAEMPAEIVDIVTNPGPGDWGCWSTLVTTRTSTEYRVTSGFVAPFATVRSLDACTARYRNGRIGGDALAGADTVQHAPFTSTSRVRWRASWSAPVAQLAQLSRAHCEVAAALYFMRTPVWHRPAPNQLVLSDARFGLGDGGFSNIPIPTRSECTLRSPWIPGWVPPRAAFLETTTP